MIITKQKNEMVFDELKNKPVEHLIECNQDNFQSLESLTQTRLDNGLCPLCGLKPETVHTTSSGRWFCLGALCPNRKV